MTSAKTKLTILIKLAACTTGNVCPCVIRLFDMQYKSHKHRASAQLLRIKTAFCSKPQFCIGGVIQVMAVLVSHIVTRTHTHTHTHAQTHTHTHKHTQRHTTNTHTHTHTYRGTKLSWWRVHMEMTREINRDYIREKGVTLIKCLILHGIGR